MKDEKEISLTKQIYQNYKKNFANKGSTVTLLALFIVLCLIGAYFVPITLFISVPFIICPLLVGFIFTNTATAPSTKIFSGFRSYYSAPFFGAFRILGAILKSLIVYLAVSTILTLILHFSVGLSDPNYVTLIDEILKAENNNDLVRLIGDLQANPAFLLITNVSEIVAFGLASYMFIHHVLTHSFKVYFNLFFVRFIPMAFINLIHKRAFPNFRKEFYKDYYSSFFYIFILFVLGYVGFSLLGVFVFHQSGLQAGVIGLAGAILLTIYFLPIIYDVYSLMYTVCNVYYLKALLEIDGKILGVPPILSNVEREKYSKVASDLERIIKETEEQSKAENGKKE